MALEFLRAGYPKVFAIKGGWKEWKDSDFPTEIHKP
ncbi:MAG: rhodanese-like domain-containing protein [Thermodesulfobacteriota bacterium]